MIEIEYIAVESCCAQLSWIKQQLKDYGIDQNKILLKYDNTSTINLTKNFIQHSKIKYIKIRHHFIRDHVQNSDIVFEFISTKN